MPGIFVSYKDEETLKVKTPYYMPYIKRLRKIDGARWSEEDEAWIVPIESAEELDDAFYDELIYEMNREKLLGLKPRPLPKILKEIPPVEVYDLKMELRPFQKFGVNFLAYVMKKHGVGLLGDLMGSGKTFQSIATAMQLKQEGLVCKVLVVVLAPTRLQWIKEIEKFTNEKAVLFGEFKTKYSYKGGKKTVVESVEDQKLKLIQEFKDSDTMFMIMSYQGMQQNAELLEEANFDMIIMDEAHYIKNRLAKTNKAAQKLIKPRTKRSKFGEYKGIPYTLLVSGTPIMNYPDEIYGLIGIANEKIFGKWRDFRKTFCVLNEYKDIIGYQNLSKLRDIIDQFIIRRTDEEIGVDLPKMIEKDEYIEPHPKQIKMDEALLKEQQELLKQRNSKAVKAGNENALMIEQRLKGIKNQRIAAGCHPNTFQLSNNPNIKNKWKNYYVNDLYEIPKFNRCIEIVKEVVENGHKVVIFVNSRRMTVLLHKEISKFTKVVRYIGGLSDEVRERRKYKFNHDPECRVMIANSAGSTGLNLQAGRYLINYDLPHNPAEWEQRKYRIRRLDSKHDKIFIINLINKGLVDEEMRKTLDEKQASFDSTIENSEATKKFHQQMNIKTKKRNKPIAEDIVFDFTQED